MSWKCTFLGHDYKRIHGEMITALIRDSLSWYSYEEKRFYVLLECTRCGMREAIWKNEHDYCKIIDPDFCIDKFVNYKEKK